MKYSKLTLINKSLIKLGCDLIQNLEENNYTNNTVNYLYELVKKTCLSMHDWNFAIKKQNMLRINSNILPSYDYCYEIPSDVIRILKINDDKCYIMENVVYSNFDKLEIEYISNVFENYMSDEFVNFFTTKLASEFCLPLTENTERSEYLRKKSLEEFKNATLSNDRINKPLVLNMDFFTKDR